MRRDSGHPDYRHIDMQEVTARAQKLCDSDEAAIPNGLVEYLEGGDEEAQEFSSGVDKAATPAERISTASGLERDMRRMRPQALVAQRDSDANRDVE